MNSSSNNTSSTNVIDPIFSEKYVKAMIIVCFISSLSIVTCFIIIIWKIVQKKIRETIDTFLVLNLLSSNFFQCLGFMFSYHWIILGVIKTGPVCSMQGFLINFGDVASGLWTLVLCLYILMLTFRYMCTSLVILSMVIIWPFNLTISLWGLVIQTPNSPFYDANNDSWCWISTNYKNYRVGFNYGITLIITIAVIILTAILYCRQRTISSRFTSKSLMWYPLIYIVLALPLTIYRFAAIVGYDLPFEYIILSTCIFICIGLFNSIIYGFKHFSDVPTISTPANLQRRPTPIYGIQRPLSPYSPTNSNRMLLSSPSPTTTTFSIQFSPPISPATPTFPTPLSPSFINSPTRFSQSPPYRTIYNSPARNSLSNTYESSASSSSTRYSYPERNDSSIPSSTLKKSPSKHVNSPELEKSDQKTSSPKRKQNKPRPSTFGSLSEIRSHSPSTQQEIEEILKEKDR